MQTLEVLVIVPVADEALARIAAIDPRLRVVDARGWFDGEMRDTWPQWTVQRYLGHRQSPASSRQRRDELLASAEIILGGFPFPLDLRARAPRLRWFHQLPAGASNLLRGDLGSSGVIVTTSRGYGNTRPMAEYALASFLHFARGLPQAYRDQQRHRFDHRTYRPILLEGKTVCVVGAGGIGQEVARLCGGVGMRVVGTRRQQHTPSSLRRSEEHTSELQSQSNLVCRLLLEKNKHHRRSARMHRAQQRVRNALASSTALPGDEQRTPLPRERSPHAAHRTLPRHRPTANHRHA